MLFPLQEDPTHMALLDRSENISARARTKRFRAPRRAGSWDAFVDVLPVRRTLKATPDLVIFGRPSTSRMNTSGWMFHTRYFSPPPSDLTQFRLCHL